MTLCVCNVLTYSWSDMKFWYLFYISCKIVVEFSKNLRENDGVGTTDDVGTTLLNSFIYY